MGLRAASAGSSSSTSSPEITRWRAGLQSRSPSSPAAAAARRLARRPRSRGRRHHVVHVQPDADQPIGAGAIECGHDQLQRRDQVRRELDHQLALEQRLADQARGRSSAGSAGRRGRASRSGCSCPRRNRPSRPAPRCSPRRRRRAPRPAPVIPPPITTTSKRSPARASIARSRVIMPGAYPGWPVSGSSGTWPASGPRPLAGAVLARRRW